MKEKNRRKPDVFDKVIVTFNIVLLVVTISLFYLKWWFSH